jgi:hypothetical protein
MSSTGHGSLRFYSMLNAIQRALTTNIIEDEVIINEEIECENKVENKHEKEHKKECENTPTSQEPKYRVRLTCNWTDSKSLCELWNKMSKGNYRWNDIQIVWDDKYDLTVVINCPPINEFPDPRTTIVFQMEPNMEDHSELWGGWSNPSSDLYLKVCKHSTEYNNNEWHLSKSYTELLTLPIQKTEEKIVSTVLSGKYRDVGHIKRIDFARYLDTKGVIHIYGSNRFDYLNYKGSLPYHAKDNALFPYKYTFNAENNFIPNYYTEKLIDGILAECLTFYRGPPNIKELIDERAFVWLELSDFEKDYDIIQKAIEEDWWSQRIEFIRKEKLRILNELQFFPRLEKIINEKVVKS